MKKIILLSAFILTIAFGLCGCKKDDATVHFASETEQTAVVSSDVNRQTADSKEKKASSDVDIRYFEDRETMTQELLSYVKEGDTILVKASHFMEFPKVVEALNR